MMPQKTFDFWELVLKSIPIISLIISLNTLFKNRRKLITECDFKDNLLYHTLTDATIPVSKTVYNGTDRITVPNKEKSHFVLVDVLISNNSPNPITVQDWSFTDKKGEGIDILTKFDLVNANSHRPIPSKLHVTSTYVKESYMYGLFTEIDLVDYKPFVISGFNSYIATFAICTDNKTTLPIPDVYFTCFTTIPRFKLSYLLIKLNNFVRKYKLFSRLSNNEPKFVTYVSNSYPYKPTPHPEDSGSQHEDT